MCLWYSVVWSGSQHADRYTSVIAPRIRATAAAAASTATAAIDVRARSCSFQLHAFVRCSDKATNDNHEKTIDNSMQHSHDHARGALDRMIHELYELESEVLIDSRRRATRQCFHQSKGANDDTIDNANEKQHASVPRAALVTPRSVSMSSARAAVRWR